MKVSYIERLNVKATKVCRDKPSYRNSVEKLQEQIRETKTKAQKKKTGHLGSLERPRTHHPRALYHDNAALAIDAPLQSVGGVESVAANNRYLKEQPLAQAHVEGVYAAASVNPRSGDFTLLGNLSHIYLRVRMSV